MSECTHGFFIRSHLTASLPFVARSFAQKGVSMRVPEGQTIVDAVMNGTVHKDYVVVGGAQCAQRSAVLPTRFSTLGALDQSC